MPPADMNMTRRHAAGFTAVELAVVLGVVMVLVTMVAPSIQVAMARGRINEAAQSILTVHRQARQLALTRQIPAVRAGETASRYYGVALVNIQDQPGKQAYVALTYSSRLPTAADVLYSNGKCAGEMTAAQLADPSIKPVSLLHFNRDITCYVNGSEAYEATPLAWLCQYRTGFTCDKPSSASTALADVGVAGSVLANSVQMRTQDGRLRAMVAIYRVGIGHVQQ